MTQPATRSRADATDDGVAASIRRYQDRLAKDPSSLAFAPLAELHRKAGRPQEAVRLCREGLERVPSYSTARLILARALVDEGDTDGALSEVRAILEKSPKDASAHRLASDLHRRAGRLDDAVVHLKRAVALDPSDRESRVALDVLSGAPAEGSALRQLLADDTFVTLAFGTVCLEQGLVDEAAQIFVRLLQSDPGNARARERLDEALRIKTQRRKGS